MEKKLVESIKNIASKDNVIGRYNLSSICAKELPIEGFPDQYAHLLKKYRFSKAVKQGTISTALALPLLLANPITSTLTTLTATTTLAYSALIGVDMAKGALICLNINSAHKLFQTLGRVKRSMCGTVHCKNEVSSVDFTNSYLISIKDSETDNVSILSVSKEDYKHIKEDDEIVAFTLDNKTTHILKVL